MNNMKKRNLKDYIISCMAGITITLLGCTAYQQKKPKDYSAEIGRLQCSIASLEETIDDQENEIGLLKRGLLRSDDGDEAYIGALFIEQCGYTLEERSNDEILTNDYSMILSDLCEKIGGEFMRRWGRNTNVLLNEDIEEILQDIDEDCDYNITETEYSEYKYAQ